MKKGIYFYIKGLIDLLLAILAFIMLLPLFLLISLAIKLNSSGPILSKEKRTGYKGVEFNLYKFRATTNNIISNNTSKNKLTNVGKLLLKTSLDQLPQILNILKGDMSFIGPRPLKVEYQKYFTGEQTLRLEVMPGITGLSQAYSKKSTSIVEKIELDIEYINRYSFFTDLLVIYKTIKTLFKTKLNQTSKEETNKELLDLKNNYYFCFNINNEIMEFLDEDIEYLYSKENQIENLYGSTVYLNTDYLI